MRAFSGTVPGSYWSSGPRYGTSRQLLASVCCTSCSNDRILTIRARFSTCHGHGNSPHRVESQQFEGPAPELGGRGADGDRGLRPVGQHHPVQREVGQLGRETVGGIALPSGLGGGPALARSNARAGTTGLSRLARVVAGASPWSNSRACRLRMCLSTRLASRHQKTWARAWSSL